ncbi:uncharacterized protein LOC125513301 isoform X1 [Triticum urartu]|uniref:uncharacterized protein LOC125513301 isoform X1 n=1 Tax=Triticum urartu TaxID=4572 RepID=UPI0020449D99|nr:uncharacterized protein LOC125513301 isoform X1 [Triticum urartu]
MLNLSDHDEVQPDDVQEEIDLDDYDEMLEFLGPKRLEMLMTCQVTALKSMKTVKQLNGETLAGLVDKIDIDILMTSTNRDKWSGTKWPENLIEKVFNRLTVKTFAMSKLNNESTSD